MSEVLKKVMSIIGTYLDEHYPKEKVLEIECEIKILFGEGLVDLETKDENVYTYDQIQDILATLNEKEAIRKKRGVYYTPSDVVNFILFNSFKFVTGDMDYGRLHSLDLNEQRYSTICFDKIVFDPTCGAGEFLISALEIKMTLLDQYHTKVTRSDIHRVLKTIKGNDINNESILITKLRLLLFILKRYGADNVKGIAEILNNSFTNDDYVSQIDLEHEKYDVIIGNPPYVEESKSGLQLKNSYGNIYANVLENASKQLKDGGILGFIIPLSYVSTLRMKKIREVLCEIVPEQCILNYSDRPDCLFTSVHQKLSILFAQKKETKPIFYTGGYTYWYKEERDKLFNSTKVIKNEFVETQFIPKLGTDIDCDVYRKIIENKTPIMSLFDGGEYSIHLNMRATFWIKAFLNPHSGSEYKMFTVSSQDVANYAMCLLNSSLFWWYWVCVSDCWHITRKELNGFKIPAKVDFEKIGNLAISLENKLEETKLYVGTKQTQYEYKHKLCIDEIHAIDDYVNELFGLTAEESAYIKQFAHKYRVGGGVNK